VIEEALQHYNFNKPHAKLIRHNENMTYLVDDEESKYVLRIHKSLEGLDLSKGSSNRTRELLVHTYRNSSEECADMIIDLLKKPDCYRAFKQLKEQLVGKQLLLHTR
jgi:hypothetical protein